MQDAPSDPAAIPLYRFHAHTARWQTLAIELSTEGNIDSVIPAVRQAIEDVPRDGTVAERVMARSVLNEILARLVRRLGLERDPEVGTPLVALLTSCRSEDWSREALALLDHCALPNVPLLVRRALKMLDDRYSERTLDQARLARDLGTSASHLHRALKTHTGRCFLQHLHARRTSAANRMIRGTRDAFDAIAARVGYSDATQLRRRIVREFGTTPRMLRVGVGVSPAESRVPPPTDDAIARNPVNSVNHLERSVGK